MKVLSLQWNCKILSTIYLTKRIMEEQKAKELHEPENLPYQGDQFLLEEENEVEELSPTDRILYVVTSPKRAFQGLHRARLGPILGICTLVIAVLTTISTALMFSSDEFLQQTKEQQISGLEKVMDKPGLSEEDREGLEKKIDDIENTSAATFILFGALFGSIGALLVVVIIALIVFVIAKILEKGRETRVRFGQALAVTSLSAIITVLVSVVFAVIVLVSGNPDFAKGFAAIVQTDSAVLGALVGALSPQSIWWYVVTGIGIAMISKASVLKSTLSLAAVIIIFSIVLGVIGEMVGNIMIG